METGPAIRLVWPPPGLEHGQGVLYRKAIQLGLGSAVLAVPYLLAVTLPQEFYSLGVFGSAWWVPGVTTLLGLAIVLQALAGLFHFLLNARQAAHYAIDLDTVLEVGSDYDGDMAALIQGTRVYRSLKEPLRIRAIRARIWTTLLILSAAVWLSLGWIVSLVLAGQDLLGPLGVWALALGPSLLILVAVMVAKGLEGTAVQGAFGPLLRTRWHNQGQRNAAEIWGEGVRRLRGGRVEDPSFVRRMLVVGAGSVLLLTGITTVSATGFALTSAAGPALSTMAVPRFSAISRRAAEAEAIRHLRLSVNPEITPLEAGEALHALVSVGRPDLQDPLFKSPPRWLDTQIFSQGAETPIGIPPSRWPKELFPVLAGDLDTGQQEYLSEIAAHPALAEFETLARAGAMDALGARVQLPLPDHLTSWEIPIPRFQGIREAGYAMVAKAGVEFLEGRSDQAEETLRALLSSGLLLSEESPTLIGSLIGFVLASNAADALEGLFSASHMEGRATDLHRIRETARAAAESVQSWSPTPGPGEMLKQMPGLVTDDAVIRGLRWEYFNLLSGLRPCINPHQMVFGGNDDFAAFQREARAGLVRYPADEAVFNVMLRGWFQGPEEPGIETAIIKTVRTVLGPGSGQCAALLAVTAMRG